jgi:D-alanine-D-alanine ligase
MDKDVMKRLLREAGLPVVRFVTLRGAAATDAVAVADRVAEVGIGYPCFVKPANLGSSVGISKVAGAAALPAALRTASRYDTKILVEEGVVGREFEIAVIGSAEDGPEGIRTSVPGEVIPGREFYDYVDKYVGTGSRTIVPAHLPADCGREMAALARRAFEVLECHGMARVDFFLREGDQKLFVNEINTIPGTTPISLFPQMWEASGVLFADVVDRLIALALERHRRRARLETSFTPAASGPARGKTAARSRRRDSRRRNRRRRNRRLQQI